MDKWNCMELRSFCIAYKINKLKKKQNDRKYFGNYAWRIYTELKNLNNSNKQLINKAKNINGYL